MLILHDRAKISTRQVTPEGYLKLTGLISRAGIYKYTRMELGLSDGNPFELLSVYRPPAEVFAKEAMDSFANKPVTDNHPPEDVTAENFRKYAVGMSGVSVMRQGDHLMAEVLVTDAATIKKINAGKVELSPGYGLVLEMTPGTAPDGTPYHAIQRQIRGNHIAIVDVGRCGGTCRLADSASKGPCSDYQSCDCEECLNQQKKGYDQMNDQNRIQKTVVVDGISLSVEDHVAQLIDKVVKARDEANDRAKKLMDQMYSQVQTLNDTIAKKDSEIATLKASTSSEQIANLADERLRIISQAADFLADDYDTKGKSNAQIARDAVAANLGTEAVSNKSDEYVLAAFDTMRANGAGQQPGLSIGRVATPKMRAADANDNGQFAYNQRLTQAWMPADMRQQINGQ